ncbi:hypothetical protein FB451DRAFT_1263586 [Mycena latifolia]|nr:hypothetical protein FB451DRAFT_1263586 [Mycena latifolia]
MNSVREVLTPDISTVVGPVFIANILNWMFLGTLTMQLYTYYQLFPTDRLVPRILVYSLFLVDVAQTVMLTSHGWYFMVTTWGDPSKFDILPWTAAMIPIPSGIISTTVQIFYSWRIWILASNRFLRAMSILIVVIALMQGFAAIIPGSLLLHPPTQENLIHLHPAFSVWLSGSFVVDTLITVCMTYILFQAKTSTICAPTETILTKLIHRVIQTGAASAICAAVDLAMFVGFPSTNFHVVPAYILGKLYTNSLMLTLNLRHPTAPGSNNHNPEPDVNSFRFNETLGSTGVHIHRTVDIDRSISGIWSQKDDQKDDLSLEHIVHMSKINTDGKSDTARRGTETV